MRALTYLVATTLDGYIAGPDGADPSSFWPMTPDYVAHLIETYPETLPGQARDALGVDSPARQFDTVIEGRRSYEVGLAAGVADAYPHLRHLVVSASLDQAADRFVELVSSDPIQRVRELKAEEGLGVWLVGGATLAGSLIDEIDRLILKVAPMRGSPCGARTRRRFRGPGDPPTAPSSRAGWCSRSLSRPAEPHRRRRTERAAQGRST